MKLAPLVAIEVVAFLLIIAEAYAFFAFVVPLGPVPHNLGEYTSLALLKVVLAFGLGVVWFVVIAALTEAYVKSRLSGPTPSPSS
jgi:hypothetical protein